MDQPIACSLPATEMAARQEDTANLARAALRSRDPVDGGVRLTFSADAATERTLRELIAAEAQCCPFLRFDLAREDDALRLDVTGPAEAQPIVAELFAAGG